MRLSRARGANVLLLTIALLSAPALAGCLEASGAALDEARAKVGLPPDEVPARSVADDAADEAEAWNASAVLVGITGVERTPPEGMPESNETDAEEDGEEDADAANPIPEDPEVANGKAPAWFFRYETEDAALMFLVHANGTITDREESPKDDAGKGDEDASAASAAWDGPFSVGDWPVNSHEAWDLVAENATWNDAMTNVTPFLAFSTLFPMPEDLDEEDFEDENATMPEPVLVARWLVYAMNETGHGAGAIVNAVNGTIEDVFPWEPFQFDFDWDWDWGGSGGSWGGWSGMGDAVACCAGEPSFSERYEGTVTVVADTMSHDVPVSAEGEAVFLLVEHQSPNLVGDGVSVRLLGPDDEEVELERQDWSNFGFNMPGVRYVAYPPGPGEYVLEVTLNFPNLFADYAAEVEVGVPTMAEEEDEDDDGRAPAALPVKLPVALPAL